MVLAQLSMLTSLNKSLFGLSFLSAFGSGVSISSLYFLTASEPSVSFLHKFLRPVANAIFVKLRQGSGKDRQGMAVKVKGLKA